LLSQPSLILIRAEGCRAGRPLAARIWYDKPFSVSRPPQIRYTAPGRETTRAPSGTTGERSLKSCAIAIDQTNPLRPEQAVLRLSDREITAYAI